MGAVRVIVGARRNQFHSVRAKDNQVTHVLVPLVHVPAVVGIGLRTVAKLVAAQRGLGCAGDAEVVRDFQRVPLHAQLPEQRARAEQDAASVIAHHQRYAVDDLDPKPFDAWRNRPEMGRQLRSGGGNGGLLSDQDGRTRSGPAGSDR